jgi:hypothetical protein
MLFKVVQYSQSHEDSALNNESEGVVELKSVLTSMHTDIALCEQFADMFEPAEPEVSQ